MMNIKNLTLSKFCLDAILTKSGAAEKGWIWLLVEEVFYSPYLLHLLYCIFYVVSDQLCIFPENMRDIIYVSEW